MSESKFPDMLLHELNNFFLVKFTSLKEALVTYKQYQYKNVFANQIDFKRIGEHFKWDEATTIRKFE